MTKPISLTQWFKTGHFGELKFGINREAFEAQMGEPDELSWDVLSCFSPEYGWHGSNPGVNEYYTALPAEVKANAVCWRYGHFRFLFNPYLDDNFYCIKLPKLEAGEVPHGGHNLILEDVIVKGGMHEDEFQARLNAQGIEYKAEVPGYDDLRYVTTNCYITTQGGVYLTFINNSGYSPYDVKGYSGLYAILHTRSCNHVLTRKKFMPRV